MVVDKIDYYGIGLSIWKDRILFFMGKRVKYFPDLKKLLFKRNLDNMHREYLALIARGYKKCDIVKGSGDIVVWNKQTYKMARLIRDKTNLPLLFVLMFFLAMYRLASIGKIPFKVWNPKEYDESVKLKKTLATEKGILQKVGISTKLLPVFLVGGLVGGFFLSQKIDK